LERESARVREQTAVCGRALIRHACSRRDGNKVTVAAHEPHVIVYAPQMADTARSSSSQRHGERDSERDNPSRRLRVSDPRLQCLILQRLSCSLERAHCRIYFNWIA
jgi:hypothetical protein